MFSWKAYRQKMNGFWNDGDFRCSRSPARPTNNNTLFDDEAFNVIDDSNDDDAKDDKDVDIIYEMIAIN
jgi:hypothetical protein